MFSSTPSTAVMVLAIALLVVAVPDSADCQDIFETPESSEQEAADPGAPPGDAGAASTNAALNELRALLEEQRRQIQSQQARIERQQEELASQTTLLQGMQTRIDQLAMEQEKLPELTPDEVELREELASLQQQLSAIPEDPVAALGEEGFPGSLRIPGTSAAMKIGGFVKGTLVKSFDPLATTDRFIVGTIPVAAAEPGVEEETSLTANQSRLNLEMRDKTGVGELRGFIEADFAASGDTFRLRHAYGQYRSLLTGKTWSTFFDPLAGPEEIDFEGINGRTILRQTQIRFFPRIGRDWDLQVALEDPQSEVSEIDLSGSPDPDDPGYNPSYGQQQIADGVSEWPDLVASIRRTWFGRWHLKTAFVAHQVRAQYSQEPDLPTKNELGLGFSASGAFKAPWFDERDNIKFQAIVGDGIGHYVNDPSSVGGQDGVFTPDGSKIKTLPIVAGFAAYQHWWTDTLRSNFIVSGVQLDNEDFQPFDAYKRTIRASGNLFWSPTPRVDVAAEFIWGQRTNKNGDEGDASQIQFATTYRF
jgi:hypothetical protein